MLLHAAHAADHGPQRVLLQEERTYCTGAASACQGTAQTPRRLAQTSLTQTTIQMINDVWNLGVEIGFAKPNVPFLSLGLRNLDLPCLPVVGLHQQ